MYLELTDKQSKVPSGKGHHVTLPGSLPGSFRSSTLDYKRNETYKTYEKELQNLLDKKQFDKFVANLGQALPDQRSAAFNALATEYYKGYRKKEIFTQVSPKDVGMLIKTLIQDISSADITRSLCAGKFMHMFSQINESSKKAFLDVIKKPGTNPCQRLYSNYGLYHFARYDITYLKMALDERPLKPGEKLILLSYPNTDWNGGFRSTPVFSCKEDLSNFFDDHTSSKVRLKICESGTQEQLKQRLLNIHSKFGSADMMIIGGHGSKTRIQLGSDITEGGRGLLDNTTISWGLRDDPRTVDISDRDVLKTIASCTKPTGSVVLVSCSTGQGFDSIGQRLSRYFAGLVFAPNQDSFVPSIAIQNSKLFVNYNNSFSQDIKTMAFERGRIRHKYYDGAPYEEKF